MNAVNNYKHYTFQNRTSSTTKVTVSKVIDELKTFELCTLNVAACIQRPNRFLSARPRSDIILAIYRIQFR